MEIEKIYFIEEIKDVNNDNIEVFVENEDGYTYVISAATPQYFLEEMNQKKTNFVRPGPPVIIVKKLTKEIVMEAVKACAEGDGCWLKLHQFALSIGISTLNKLEVEDRKNFDDFEEFEDF